MHEKNGRFRLETTVLLSCHVLAQLLAAQHMEMEVLHALAGILSAVGDDAEAALQDTLAFCDPAAGPEACGEHIIRDVLDFADGGDVLLWHDQDMGLCHGIDIPEGIGIVVLIDFGGGNLACNDLAEKAVRHKQFLLS